MKEITSVQNPLVKEILQLQEKSRARKKSGLFIIEGVREISLAIKGGFKLSKIVCCKSIAPKGYLEEAAISATEKIEISKEVYRKIAHRDSTEGVIAIAHIKNATLTELDFQKPNPLILVAEAPEKPGNIGALLRTADAANLDAVLIANPKTDLYNPNIIRSSVGCVFTNQVAMATSTEIIRFLKGRHIHIFCAALQSSESYDKVDYTSGTAIVVGTEATGLSNDWLDQSTKNILIPMNGQIDSLNVSVSAGILIFEAKRQRNYE